MSPQPQPRPVILATRAGRLYAERIEAGGGPTLVFLHEALGCVSLWRDFPARLAAASGLDALVYDRLGFGRSEPRPPPADMGYLAHEARAALAEVLDAAAIDEAVLVGHSDGATLALLAAAALPGRVRAVVAAAAHVFVEEVTRAGIRSALEAYRHGGLKERLARHHGARTDDVVRAWADVWLAPESGDWDITADIASVRCPVLALQGADDAYGSPAQLAAIAAAVSGPVETWLVAGCGHIPHHQARAAVLERTVRFIGEAVSR